jgi:hypothetical protein
MDLGERVSELLEILYCSQVGHLDMHRFGYCRRCHLLAETDRAVGNDGAAPHSPRATLGSRSPQSLRAPMPAPWAHGDGAGSSGEHEAPLPGPEIDN